MNLCLLLSLVLSAMTASNAESLQFLDQNADAVIDPYEALDMLLVMEEELAGPITVDAIDRFLAESRQEGLEEASEMLAMMDDNGDGSTTLDEVDPGMREFAELFDTNGDGVLSVEEVHSASMESELLMSADDIEMAVGELFQHTDADGDGALTARELGDDEEWDRLTEADADRDGRVTRDELTGLLFADNTLADFVVKDGVAVMSGVIGADTPAKVLRLALEHPGVRTIEMSIVPGSIDDEANLRAARYVRKFGFTTVLGADSKIASGGTDFFLGGKQRRIAGGARLGIHSWGGPGFEGKDVPRDDPAHRLYLDYYEEMGIPAAFYWRTLDAAPADGIHWMTERELEKFGFRR